MEITLVIFYYIYLCLVGIFLIFAFFHLYHLVRFGFISFGTIFFGIVFVLVSVLILFFSYEALQNIDWTETINILGVNENYF